MRAQIIKRLNDIRTSYWFVPLLMVTGALILTQFMTSSFVMSYDELLHGVSWISFNDVDGARVLLSTVSGAILGVAGVTFSITIVAVSFASSNFGPRLINNFMGDRGSQYTLGTFLGTFVYCLMVLNNVRGSSNDAAQQSVDHQIPQIATLMALPLALASIGVLIYFIHHIAETINIDNIVANIGCRLIVRIQQGFPGERSLGTVAVNRGTADSQKGKSARATKERSKIAALNNGYVQAVDGDRLQRLTDGNDYHLEVHYGPGDFVCSYDQLMSVWSDAAKLPIDEKELRACFAVGAERTENQNALFLVEQLAEVIARALSPGVNDPYTAIGCLNQYKSALSAYLNNCQDRALAEGQSNSRACMRSLGFDRIVKAMFEPCRQYICADTNVALHTMSVLAECAWQAGPGKAQRALLAQLHAIEQSASQQSDTGVDTQRISQRLKLALKHINEVHDQPLTGTAYFWHQLESTDLSPTKADHDKRNR